MDRILVVRIGNIGDVLMATPLVRKLKTMFPQTAIDFVVSPHAEFAVKGNKFIDNLYVYRKYSKVNRKLRKFLFKRRIRRNKYKICFVLESNREYMQFAYDVTDKNTLKIGYDGYACSNLLDKKNKYLYKTHVIENQLFLLRDFLKAEILEPDFRMDFWFPENISRKFSEEVGRELKSAGDYFVVHPGCTEYLPLRAWQSEKFAEVINFVADKGLNVFITGSKNDKKVIDDILNACGNMQNVTVFIGKNIWSAARLISRAKGVVSLDTGILHLTRALGTPLVGLFGPSDPAHTGPIGEGFYKVIRKDFKCGPCHYYPEYRLEDKKKCLDGNVTPCMKAITAHEVISLVEGMV
ncbi:MAG: glycosyltransferase family 9 protein [Candidatus Omnitrophota bacterium]|nr:glycosyltransferase family 9 protein [Candidatus Omnitrophota bacterium]MBU1894715.1 glycosyltransferase family 9 protein [Candidatus Omnitrophota bacterium]